PGLQRPFRIARPPQATISPGADGKEATMARKVFIDGDVGTTGLQIRERLERRDDIALVRIDPALRKDNAARLAAFAEAEVAILCLPDPAAKEIVAACDAA